MSTPALFVDQLTDLSFDFSLQETLCWDDQFLITIPSDIISNIPASPTCTLDDLGIDCSLNEFVLSILLPTGSSEGTLVLNDFLTPDTDEEYTFSCGIDNVSFDTTYSAEIGFFSAISFLLDDLSVSTLPSFTLELTSSEIMQADSSIKIILPEYASSETCEVTNVDDLTCIYEEEEHNLLISDVFAEDLNADTLLTLTISGIQNPPFTLLEDERNVLIQIVTNGTPSYEDEITLEGFEFGTFESGSIEMSDDSANALATYTFSFTTSKPVLTDSVIVLVFPDGIIPVENLTPVEGPDGFESATFTVDGQNFVISNYFTADIAASQAISFSIAEIYNPEVSGSLLFDLYIYSGSETHVIEQTPPDFNIVVVGRMSVDLDAESVYNDETDYFAFTLESMDENDIFFNEYTLRVLFPDLIPSCDIDTLEGVLNIKAIVSTKSFEEGELLFTIELEDEIDSAIDIEFQLQCTNPSYSKTTEAFEIELEDTLGLVINKGQLSSYRTYAASEFTSATVSIDPVYPSVASLYEFTLTTNTQPLTKIAVRIPVELQDTAPESPTCAIVSGLSGELNCYKEGTNIYLTEIASDPVNDNVIVFSIGDFINPETAEPTNSFTIDTFVVESSESYNLQTTSTKLPIQVDCDYPCQTCEASDECTACFQTDEYTFAEPLPFLKTDLQVCVSACNDLDYYPDGTDCKPCEGPCEHCTSQTECLKCLDVALVLMGTDCQEDCDEHYYADEDNVCQECDSTCQNCETLADYCLDCDQTGDHPLFYVNVCYDECPMESIQVFDDDSNTNLCRSCVDEANEMTAQMANEWELLRITFTYDVLVRNQVDDDLCVHIFGSGSDSLGKLGTEPSCSVVDKTLEIILGEDHLVEPAQTLVFAEDTLYTSTCEVTSIHEEIVIPDNTLDMIPGGVLEGPSLHPIDTELVLEVKEVTKLGKREELSILFQCTAADDAASLTEIQTSLSDTQTAWGDEYQYSITIPADKLVADITYTFTVTVQNFLQIDSTLNTIQAIEVTGVASGVLIPQIYLEGVDYLILAHPIDEIEIRTLATLDGSTDNLIISWEQSADDDDILVMTAIEANTDIYNVLKFASYDLTLGIYHFTVTAAKADETNIANSKDIVIEIQESKVKSLCLNCVSLRQ